MPLHEIKEGDVVRGPSLHEPNKVRTWRVTCVSTTSDYLVGQNVAAKKPFRHVLDGMKVEKVQS